MTRTNKWTVHEGKPEPKYFSHTGPLYADPNKVSKSGGGKFNWGKPGDELLDDDNYAPTGRRNSNHEANESVLRAKDEFCNSQLDL